MGSFFNYMNIEMLHLIVGTLSSIVCVVTGFALFAIRLSRQVDLQLPVRCVEYGQAGADTVSMGEVGMTGAEPMLTADTKGTPIVYDE